MKILAAALDPGRTTGFALAEKASNTSIILRYGQAELSHYELLARLEEWRPAYLICESFEYRRYRTGVDLTPIELIGVVKLWTQIYDAPLTLQSAAKGKNYWTDVKLKNFGYYVAGIPHGRDACRHLLHWLSFGRGFEFASNATIELGADSPGEEKPSAPSCT